MVGFPADVLSYRSLCLNISLSLYPFFIVCCCRGAACGESVQPESCGDSGQHSQTRVDGCNRGHTVPHHHPQHRRFCNWFESLFYSSFWFVFIAQLWMKTQLWRWHLPVLHVMSAGTESIQKISGNQTTFDLRDLTVGVSYSVSVTALVGENEGDPVTVYIKPGDVLIICWCVSFSCVFSIYLSIAVPGNRYIIVYSLVLPMDLLVKATL